jgi:cephalosporin hydroxylase
VSAQDLGDPGCASNARGGEQALTRTRRAARRLARRMWERTGRPAVTRLFLWDLVNHTENFAYTRWAGRAIWQNVLDLWTIQETIAELRPALLIETGTFRGGSALFYANVMDLLGEGRVLTIDVEKYHDLQHPRIDFLLGSSTDPDIVARVREITASIEGPVMVILDGDHSRDHVAVELELYAPLVTPGSFLLSQDGIVDQLGVFRDHRPGPLPANEAFLRQHPEFELDRERNERFLLTYHPVGWLRRRG